MIGSALTPFSNIMLKVAHGPEQTLQPSKPHYKNHILNKHERKEKTNEISKGL